MENVRSSTDKIDLRKYNFMAAFGIRDANSKEPLDDPNFVEYLPYISLKDKGENKYGEGTIHIPLEFHKCTKDDYRKFYPTSDLYKD